MNPINPLREIHVRSEATFMDYGPGGGASPIELVETFGQYEAEYAAIRKSAGLMDQSHRGLVRLTGADRTDLLQRLLTNDVVGLGVGGARRAMMLNNKGRITADLTVLQGEGHTDVELDATDVERFMGDLDRYLFTEDVQVSDLTAEYGHLALFGAKALGVLGRVGGSGVEGLEPLTHGGVEFGSQTITVFRRDDTGSVGLHLLVPRGCLVDLYMKLIEPSEQSGVAARPVGWLAYNTARIEAGTPLYHIDFGPDTLPHETGGLLDQTVSFTKGCYSGQEVVARMQNLGHPKQVLVGLRIESDGLPIAGTEVFEHVGEGDGEGSGLGQVVGAITSSTLSPMLSGSPVALAMVKWGKHKPQTELVVPAEGQMQTARVQGLPFV